MNEFKTFTDDLKSELKWLISRCDDEYSGLKQQKFLLLYNLFLEVELNNGNFIGLCAWKNGPVYTQVHAAVKHHYSVADIINSIENEYTIDEVLATVAKFIIDITTDECLSEITHEFDFWKQIDDKFNDNVISVENITKEDKEKVKEVLSKFDLSFIMSHKIYKTDKAIFLINKDEYDFVKENLSNSLNLIESNKPIKIILKDSKINKKEYLKIF